MTISNTPSRDAPDADHTQALDSPAFRSLLEACIHCGLCLPACPTYEVLGWEPDSPRGRISLMGAVADGRLPLEGETVHHLDRCLGCRACETACPSGVQYGRLLEITRSAQRGARGESGVVDRPAGVLGRWLTGTVLSRRWLLRLASRVHRLLAPLGVIGAARRLPLPPALRAAAELAPPPELATPRPADDTLRPAFGEPIGTVALFRGCIQDAFLGVINSDTEEVLRHAGFDVWLPGDQTCCGALARHAGHDDIADRLLMRNDSAFAPRDVPIVVNAGGCGAMLAGDHHGHDIARRVVDLSEVLTERTGDTSRPLDLGPVPARVTYLDSCHLRHGMGVSDAPRALLRAIPGVTLVEAAEPDACCGSAGVYNLTQPELADRILDRRMEHLRATDADIVVVTNPGCHLQIIRGAHRRGWDVEVLHLAQLLARSMRAVGSNP